MIISASRRTDIPAFYSEWFMNRISEGYFIRINPMNKKQQKAISLLPKDVDVIVFWTKNPAPLVERLDELDRLGYKYYFQFTLNDYPKTLEPRVPTLSARVDIFKRLSEKLGVGQVIWRYDPVVISRETPVDYHLERFDNLAKSLNGYADRVVVSFLDFYGKVERKLKKLNEANRLNLIDVTNDACQSELFWLAKKFSASAKTNNMDIYTCSEKVELEQYGLRHGSCIDIDLINKVFDLSLQAGKDKAQRPECLCAASVDMGTYDTCKFNCSYCYATVSEKAMLNNMKAHDPQSPLMVGEASSTDADFSIQPKLC